MFGSGRRLTNQEINALQFVANAPAQFGRDGRSYIARKDGGSALVIRQTDGGGGVVVQTFHDDRDPRLGFTPTAKAARLALLLQAVDDVREIAETASLEALTQIVSTRGNTSQIQEAFVDFINKVGPHITNAKASAWSRSNS